MSDKGAFTRAFQALLAYLRLLPTHTPSHMIPADSAEMTERQQMVHRMNSEYARVDQRQWMMGLGEGVRMVVEEVFESYE